MKPVDVKETLTDASRHSLGTSKTVVGDGAVHGGIAWRYPQYGTSAQNFNDAAGPGTGIVAPTGASWSGGSWSGASSSGSGWS